MSTKANLRGEHVALGPYFQAVALSCSDHNKRHYRSGDMEALFPAPYHETVGLGFDMSDLELQRRVALTALTNYINSLRIQKMTKKTSFFGQLFAKPKKEELITEADVVKVLRGETSFEELLGHSATIKTSTPSLLTQRNGIFGCPLDELPASCRNCDSGLPRVIIRLMQLIYDKGCNEYGLFRLEGNSEFVDKLMQSISPGFESSNSDGLLEQADVHDLAALFKRYLRSIPGLLVPFTYVDALYALRNVPDNVLRMRMSKLVLLCLPQDNLRALSGVVLFLRAILTLPNHTISPDSLLALSNQVMSRNANKNNTSNFIQPSLACTSHVHLANIFMPTLFAVPSDFGAIAWMTGILAEILQKHLHQQGEDVDAFEMSQEWATECIYNGANKTQILLSRSIKYGYAK